MFFEILTIFSWSFLVVHDMGRQGHPPTLEIVQKSTQAIHDDWRRAPSFDFCELDRDEKGARLYQVLMISGSPYNRLVGLNGSKLSTEMQEREAKKLADVMQQRQKETPEEHQRRVAKYEKERRGDQLLLEELTEAMEFTLIGSETVDSHETYVLDAAPKPGYVPKNIMTRVLSGMRGRLWVDQASFRWVKVTAEVVHPVMIEGFVARVEPGTQFELEEMPVADQAGTWLPRHFMMQSRAKILLLFSQSSRQDETYSEYKPNGTLSPEECLQP
jgi:hypothetical protein